MWNGRSELAGVRVGRGHSFDGREKGDSLKVERQTSSYRRKKIRGPRVDYYELPTCWQDGKQLRGFRENPLLGGAV